jgi:hypothetical protein
MYRDIISASVTHGHLVPEIMAVSHESVPAVAKLIQQGKIQAVLKRSFSYGTDHVFWPGKKGFQTIWSMERHWKNSGIFGSPQWLVQPFLPLMQALGELRAFLTNGVLFYVLWSDIREGLFLYSHVTEFRPLSLFR